MALVGRNGAGNKTTLLKSIMGILPARRGRVTFCGHDITRLPPHEIARRGVTLVPEDRRIFPRLTVAENLKVAARARGGGHDGAQRRSASSPTFRACASGCARPARASRAASSRCSPSREDSWPGRTSC